MMTTRERLDQIERQLENILRIPCPPAKESYRELCAMEIRENCNAMRKQSETNARIPKRKKAVAA